MRLSSRLGTVLVSGLMVSLVAGCGGDDPEPMPPAANAPVSSSPARDKRPPTWRKDFSRDEVAAYRTAEKRWETYTERSAPIWEKGRATPKAEALFEEFFYQPDVMFQLLESYERRDVTVRGIPLVLSSRPAKVRLDQDPVTVVVRQCIDARPVQMTVAGVPLTDPDQLPMTRRITLSRVDDGPFQVIAYKGPETGDKHACS